MKFSKIRIGVVLSFVVLVGVAVFIGQRYVSAFNESDLGILFNKFAQVGRETQAFSDEVSRIESAGLPVRIEDALPKSIPDADNANFHYFEAVRLLFDPADPHNSLAETYSFKEINNKMSQSDVLVDPSSLGKAERDQLVVEAIQRAADCEQSVPFFRRELTVTTSLFMSSPLEFDRTQRKTALAENRFDDAVDSILRNLKLIRVFSNEPGDGPDHWARLETWPVTNDLNYILRSTKLPTSVLDRLDDELALHDSPKGRRKKALEARVFYIEDIKKDSTVQMQWAFADQSEMLEMYRHQIEISDKPFFEVRDKFHPGTFAKKNVAGWNLEAVFEQRHGEWSFHIANVRCLRILIAIEKFRREKGHEPSGVADLEIKQSQLINPMTGKPIIPLLKENGWRIEWDYGGFTWFDYGGHCSDIPRGCIPLEDLETAKKK